MLTIADKVKIFTVGASFLTILVLIYILVKEKVQKNKRKYVLGNNNDNWTHKSENCNCCLAILKEWKIYLIILLSVFIGWILSPSSQNCNRNGQESSLNNHNLIFDQSGQQICTGVMSRQDFYSLAKTFLAGEPIHDVYPVSHKNLQLNTENWKAFDQDEESQTKLFVNSGNDINYGKLLFSSLSFFEDSDTDPGYYYDLIGNISLYSSWNKMLIKEEILEVGGGEKSIENPENLRKYAGSPEQPSVRYQMLKGFKFVPSMDVLYIRGHQFFKYKSDHSYKPMLIVYGYALPPAFNNIYQPLVDKINNNNKEAAIRKDISAFGLVLTKSNNGAGTKFMSFGSETLPFKIPKIILNNLTNLIGNKIIGQLVEAARVHKKSQERLGQELQGNFFNTVEENVDKLVDILEDETWRSNNIKDSQRKGYCYPWDSNLPVSSGVDSRELNKKELDKNATLEVEHSFYEKIQSIVKKVFTVKVNVTSEEKQESYLLPPILRNHTFPEYPDDILNPGILRLRNRNIAKAIFRPKCCRIHEIDIAKSIFRTKINQKHDF